MGNYFKADLRLILLAGLSALVLVVNVLLVVHYRQNRSEIEKNYTRLLENRFDIVLDVYADMADLTYHVYIDTPEVRSLFASGVGAGDGEEKNRYRKLLLDRLSPLYKHLQTYDFRQLHFHETDNRSYLRFHRPEKYGDDLSDVRYSVAYVNREKQYIRGFEEGAIFNGYRFVYPLFENDVHIGSVEISVSMNSVIGELSKLFGREAQFVILKSQVMKKVFDSELSNYVPWFVDERYLMDRELSELPLLKERISDGDAEKISAAITQDDGKGRPFIVEADVGEIPSVLSFLPIKNFLGDTVAYLFEISDREELSDFDRGFYLLFAGQGLLFSLLMVFTVYYRFSQKKIEKMAIFDSLTNVYSRGPIMQAIGSELERYRRYRKPFCVIMIDVDHFKKVNDEFGHNSGDLVLLGISAVMRRNIRKSDFIGRYGGEEFIILLPETRGAEAVLVAEKIREMVSAYRFHRIGIVTVSCGVLEGSDQLKGVDDIVKGVDKKLYQAKRAGRNRVVF